MVVELSPEAEALLRDVEQAADGRSARLEPLLTRLARAAPPGSEAWGYAHRLLAERDVERCPWRASIAARRAVLARKGDDRAWALLGLAQSLLGHCRYAIRAYRQALALAPDNPWYAHNLGHLYDVALNRPERAVGLLAEAQRALPGNDEVTASYAHALMRVGAVREARQLMMPVARHSNRPHHHLLYGAIVELDDDVSSCRSDADAVGRQGERRRRARKRRRTSS